MDIHFSIKDWLAWPPGYDDCLKTETSPSATRTENGEETSQTPDVSFIPPLLRRRLNPLGRIAASTLLPLIDKFPNSPIVHCSRHGEVSRTLNILRDLSQAQTPSPTAFSLSVHNAFAGLISIHSKINCPISAIAAGQNDLVPCLFEALGQITQQCPQVICLFSDAPLPEFYDCQLPPTNMYALAMVVTQGTDYTLSPGTSCAPTKSKTPQAIQLLDLLRQASATLHLGAWQIQRS